MTDRSESRGSWPVRAFIALLLPLLLAAPPVFVLHRQATALAAAERELDAALSRIHEAIASIEDIDRVRAQFLARKAVVEAIEESRPDVASLFNVLGSLPAGARVDSIAMAGSELYLQGTAAAGDADVVALLEARGVRVEKSDPVAPGHFGVLANLRPRQSTESSP